eukprot:g2953.t1
MWTCPVIGWALFAVTITSHERSAAATATVAGYHEDNGLDVVPSSHGDEEWNLHILEDIYRSLGGESWTNASGWRDRNASRICTWFGVTCSNIETYSQRIIVLDLRGNSLRGTIPSSLGQLKSLQALRLSDNNIHGSIPENIGSMVSLKVLGLYNNTLTGTLPESMADLSRLEWAGLWSNNITGTIPTRFQNMTSVETLHLDRNNLTSVGNASIGNMPSLRVLTLENQLNMTGNMSDSLCSWARNETRPTCDFSGNNFTCPIDCKEIKSICKAKCVKVKKEPEERKKKKNKDPNEDIRLMPEIMRIAHAEGALNESRFFELVLEKINKDLTEEMLEGIFKAFDFDKSGNITHEELEGA